MAMRTRQGEDAEEEGELLPVLCAALLAIPPHFNAQEPQLADPEPQPEAQPPPVLYFGNGWFQTVRTSPRDVTDSHQQT